MSFATTFTAYQRVGTSGYGSDRHRLAGAPVEPTGEEPLDGADAGPVVAAPTGDGAAGAAA